MPAPLRAARPAALGLVLGAALLLAGCGEPGGEGATAQRQSVGPDGEGATAQRQSVGPGGEGATSKSQPIGPGGGGAARAPSREPTAAATAARPSSERAATSSAEAFRDAAAKRPTAYLEEPRYASADFQRGELLSLACKACHALDPGEHNDHAPSLRGVIGRRAASQPGFDYSDALRASGIVWTPAAIEAWLAEPDGFVPGTKMKFTGFRSADDRRDVVAYLLRHVGAGRVDADTNTVVP